jgi:hypothetical protein
MTRKHTYCCLVLLAAFGVPDCILKGESDEKHGQSMPSGALTNDNANPPQSAKKEIAQKQAVPPEKLLGIVLKTDQQQFKTIPINSLGVDVVNLGGKNSPPEKLVKLMAFDCLPGGLIDLEVGKRDPFLVLNPEDDGKILHIKFDGPVLYKNDCPCYVTFVGALGSDKGRMSTCMNAIELAKKLRQTKGLVVHIPCSDESLPVLRYLRGSGVGVFMDLTHKAAVSKEFMQALGDVEPRQLMFDGPMFDEMKGRLAQVESLILEISGDALPDLSPLDKLRHLSLVSRAESSEIDLEGLKNAKGLKALNILFPNMKNSDAVYSLSELQFFFMVSSGPKPILQLSPSKLNNLHDLRYLGGFFPKNTDFSFVERMPYLQTLCILNINEQNIKPLQKLQSLRCLAFADGNSSQQDFNQKNEQDLRDFMAVRPDVDVVPYQGLCLGSLWILPLAGIAAFARCFRRFIA